MENAIFITGAGQRVGLFLAEQCLAQGYPVVITYRTPRPAIERLAEQGVLTLPVDFHQADALAQLAEQLKPVVSLRAVIHNASIWLPDAQLGHQGYQQMFRLHMQMPFELTQLCLPLLQKSTSSLKDVIAISDASALSGHPDYSAYLSTKAGLDSLVQSLAKALAPHIKVNQISPGLVLFNQGDAQDYRQKRLDQNAIPIEPGARIIWQAVDYLLQSPYSTGAKIELGQLKRPFR